MITNEITPVECPYMLIPGLNRISGDTIASSALKVIETLNTTITLDDLCSISRKAPLPFYRHLVIYKLYSVKVAKYFSRGKKTIVAKYPLNAIGELLGGRDHTTIIHSIRTAEDFLNPKFGNKEFQKEWKKLEALNLNTYE